MAKTWYPTNFSGFYVNGKSYYELTGIYTTKMCYYDWKIKNEQILTPPPFRLVSDEIVN